MTDSPLFLSGLESLRLSPCGGDNGGYGINNLDNVTHLALIASLDAPLGGLGVFHVPNPLPSYGMPKLQHLHLEHIIIDHDLFIFSELHWVDLEPIELHNCYA
jgi:hypothetical protein